jgi:hypothetical protein
MVLRDKLNLCYQCSLGKYNLSLQTTYTRGLQTLATIGMIGHLMPNYWKELLDFRISNNVQAISPIGPKLHSPA